MTNVVHQLQIEEIVGFDLPDLLEKMPSSGRGEGVFSNLDDGWHFAFHFYSPNAQFATDAMGATPRDAFLVAKQVLKRQIDEWHRVRETNTDYRPDHGDELSARSPIVMIVDDDVDTALATQAIFKQLGCETVVVSELADMHRRLSFEAADLILLDWKLGEYTQGGEVVERASRLIDAFSDLRERFEGRQTKVITHSVLEVSQIQMPASAYFQHVDHWQKPLRFDQLVERGGAALSTCGF